MLDQLERMGWRKMRFRGQEDDAMRKDQSRVWLLRLRRTGDSDDANRVSRSRTRQGLFEMGLRA
jgi:hypothetical protein